MYQGRRHAFHYTWKLRIVARPFFRPFTLGRTRREGRREEPFSFKAVCALPLAPPFPFHLARPRRLLAHRHGEATRTLFARLAPGSHTTLLALSRDIWERSTSKKRVGEDKEPCDPCSSCRPPKKGVATQSCTRCNIRRSGYWIPAATSGRRRPHPFIFVTLLLTASLHQSTGYDSRGG
ncbi:hypothetical protein F4778DRAFT_104696 [Xylariomycetidae sp. FL2044]|nr:hypothetical protein F4778DRAFT_104696 [Xylariomycetidae sp. FL2044]